MTMDTESTEADPGALIVANIEILQAAHDYARTTMASLLGKHVVEIFDSLIREIDGDGDDPQDLDDVISIARRTWRRPSRDEHKDHYIWITLEATGDGNTLWVTEFAGAAGAGMVLRLSTMLGKRPFAAVMKQKPGLEEGFRTLGLRLLPGTGFELPLEFSRDALAQGFAEEDLSDALEPLKAGLRRILDARELTDHLLEAVKEAA